MLYLDNLFVLFVYQDGTACSPAALNFGSDGDARTVAELETRGVFWKFRNKSTTNWRNCKKWGHSVRDCQKLVMKFKKGGHWAWVRAKKKKTKTKTKRGSMGESELKKGRHHGQCDHASPSPSIFSECPPPGHAARNRQCTCFCTICKTSDTAKTVNLKLIRTNLDPFFSTPAKSFCNTLNFKFRSIAERGKMIPLADDSLKRPVAILWYQ